ncbi:MAG: hypothetical protein LBP23_03725 [Treponema sp.]|jgi:hypothetical protein|nr:hypothetical protein [Treponema sp.]
MDTGDLFTGIDEGTTAIKAALCDTVKWYPGRDSGIGEMAVLPYFRFTVQIQ